MSSKTIDSTPCVGRSIVEISALSQPGHTRDFYIHGVALLASVVATVVVAALNILPAEAIDWLLPVSVAIWVAFVARAAWVAKQMYREGTARL